MWFSRIVDWQEETEDPLEFMTNLKMDLDQDEVFVFTPKGEVVTLESKSTPVDFAYTIHTEVGHACRGARVNKRLVPLDTVLQSGDTVEILTSNAQDAGPSQDWLRFAKTHRAGSKIRQWFTRERREDAIDAGREALAESLRKEGLPTFKLLKSETLQEVCETLNYSDSEALYAAIGEQNVNPKSVAGRFLEILKKQGSSQGIPAPLPSHRDKKVGQAKRKRDNEVGVVVEGVDDVMIRLAKVCTPCLLYTTPSPRD